MVDGVASQRSQVKQGEAKRAEVAKPAAPKKMVADKVDIGVKATADEDEDIPGMLLRRGRAISVVGEALYRDPSKPSGIINNLWQTLTGLGARVAKESVKNAVLEVPGAQTAVNVGKATQSAVSLPVRVATSGAKKALDLGERIPLFGRVVGKARQVVSAAKDKSISGVKQGVDGVRQVVARKVGDAAEPLTKVPGAAFKEALRGVPGGDFALRVGQGVKNVAGAPGRLAHGAATGVDAALAGTRFGQAVQFAGTGSKIIARMGGRLPILGSLIGGVVGFFDVKSSVKILQDPQATTKDKVIAGAQGGFSGVSGALGLGALGIATLGAFGLTLPISVPALLTGAAVTGIGAFVLSFFKK